MTFILASKSPRRKEILEKFGYNFNIITKEIDETAIEGEKPLDYVMRVSKEKALVMAHDFPDEMIVSADTIVCIENQIFGKPKDDADAFRMLKQLQGKMHQVHTAVSIYYENKTYHILSTTQVEFKKLSDADILKYVKTKEPMDKAGAYAIQGVGESLIKGIFGDYYTVMGFPIYDFINWVDKHVALNGFRSDDLI